MLNFDLSVLKGLRIEKITWAFIPYKRPRSAGKNACFGVHGWGGNVPIARIEAGGFSGFGWCEISQREAQSIVGTPIRAMFCENGMLKKHFRNMEFPLLDWLGHLIHKPVYEIVAKNPAALDGFSVPVYDTTIYFDELHINDNKEAVDFILDEVRVGLAAGHENFKIKIGRPARWMDLQSGLQRDIDIVLAIRQLVGEKSKLMVDANNGYNLNLTKSFLSETKDAKLHWIEEAFHENEHLYADLTQWIKDNNIGTMIADGEGDANPNLIDWAKKGLIQVIQYNLRHYGFFKWLELARELEEYEMLYAPHNYGIYYGNYAQAHFASATDKFNFAEFDVAVAEGIDASDYEIKAGRLIPPKQDGFGLKLDKTAIESKGWETSFSLPV